MALHPGIYHRAPLRYSECHLQGRPRPGGGPSTLSLAASSRLLVADNRQLCDLAGTTVHRRAVAWNDSRGTACRAPASSDCQSGALTAHARRATVRRRQANPAMAPAPKPTANPRPFASGVTRALARSQPAFKRFPAFATLPSRQQSLDAYLLVEIRPLDGISIPQ